MSAVRTTGSSVIAALTQTPTSIGAYVARRIEMSVEVNQEGMRELDRRSGDGFDVTLLWSERTGSVFVVVEDRRMDMGFRVAVDPADALDAFRHPYAYSRRGRRTTRRQERGVPAA
jgi:hypothetical protein